MPTPAVITFVAYGPYHWAALLSVGVAAWLFIRVRRKARSEERRRRLDRSLGWFTLSQWILIQSIEFMPGQYDITRSLPIHICDLAGLIAAFALLTNARVLRAMLYFWGFVLSSQALLQPELIEGPDQMQYWVFWLPHAMIIALAAYDLVGRRFRPTWLDFGYAMGSILIYMGVVLLVDVPTGLNYGFVGYTPPGAPHQLAFLGDWPGRLFKAVIAVAAAMALLTAPWEWKRRKASARQAKPLPKAAGRRPMVEGVEERISI